MHQSSLHPSSETNQSQLQKHIVLLDTDIGDDIDDAAVIGVITRAGYVAL